MYVNCKVIIDYHNITKQIFLLYCGNIVTDSKILPTHTLPLSPSPLTREILFLS